MLHRRRLARLCVGIALVVFTPASIAAEAMPAPPVGEYYCDYGSGRGQVFGPGRGFFLMPGGEYRALDDEIGTYTYDLATRAIHFSGGHFGFLQITGEFVGGRYNQIDLAPKDGVYMFCSLQ